MASSPKSFIGCYEVNVGNIGGPHLTLNLQFVPNGTPIDTGVVSGTGELTMTTNPPIDIKYTVSGVYYYEAVMGQPPVVRIDLTGITLPVTLPPYTSLKVIMVLDEDWKNGEANFQYLDSEGNWQVINKAPVAQVPCFVKTA